MVVRCGTSRTQRADLSSLFTEPPPDWRPYGVSSAVPCTLTAGWEPGFRANPGAGTMQGFPNSGMRSNHNVIPGAVATLSIILEVEPIPGLISPSIFVMPRFLKSKSSADISTPTPPAKLVKDLVSRKDSRALAATSSAIALSLGSALYDIRETSGDGAAVRDKDTDWQTAYGAARMAVEIAKESSDMFPPLKAVVGAMSALIKNYDVSASCL